MGDFRLTRIAKLYVEYERRLREANALDFDDLILDTVRLLEEHEDVRSYYQNKFRYVLIDEYQDTNNLQYRLAAALAGKWENICVVGDDDQSIYRFRGATIENILSFEKQYPACRTIRLEANYRSTKHILAASHAVIEKNEKGDIAADKRVEPAGGYAEFGEDFSTEILGRLVGGIGHQNMVALLDERQDSICDRRCAAGEEGAAGAAFQFAHRFLQGEVG